ncbi:hypothetical protein CEP54_014486 [Fusarium duplospermum]|uniref:Uncharacterized protein n=1 Tax=Fusarium duplospermum TaxID=1325734 RepID=A0A428NW32_9HYPO|nr:hypothetical protein CEP54_014486 [Fusarium duplospermum]
MSTMAPLWRGVASLLPREISENPTTNAQLRAQWVSPSDVLSVLLLLGPDIVKKAVAAQAGRRITPVAFSFGWVAYAATALLDVLGAGSFMPPADVEGVLVVGADTGHSRTSSNWVLGRLLRDLTNQIDQEMLSEESHEPPSADDNKDTSNEKVAFKTPQSTFSNQSQLSGRPTDQSLTNGKPWEALRVSVFTVSKDPNPEHGVPALDVVWYSGLFIIIVQLALSIIPWILYGEWHVFLITVFGNILAIAEGSIPQVREEKWACPRRGGATVAITQGNGSRHVILIENDRKSKNGLDLEILARATRAVRPALFTKVVTAVLALLWVVLLITVAGMENHAWFLLIIGIIGSAQNLYVAGASRSPASHGIHMDLKQTIVDKSVHKVLKRVEQDYPLMGLVLLDVFYPNSLRVKTEEDKAFWKAALANKMKPNHHGDWIYNL